MYASLLHTVYCADNPTNNHSAAPMMPSRDYVYLTIFIIHSIHPLKLSFDSSGKAIAKYCCSSHGSAKYDKDDH